MTEWIEWIGWTDRIGRMAMIRLLLRDDGSPDQLDLWMGEPHQSFTIAGAMGGLEGMGKGLAALQVDR